MRLLTRSDFDGICCAVLLKELGVVDEMVYAHPKDLQDGKVEVTANDVLANVPYVAGAGMWFDHHSSEEKRIKDAGEVKGKVGSAPSTARLVYEYYGPEKLGKFDEMLKYCDKMDSADLNEDEIRDPQGWVMLGFVCDPRTGLGYHKKFKTSNLDLMQDLIEYIRTKPVEEILALPDVKERVDMYNEMNAEYAEFIKANSRADGPVLIIDTRGKQIPSGNRFLEYTLFPKTNVSVRLIDGRMGKTVSITAGYSIINKTATADIGAIMLKYGGGGHNKVGTCQVETSDAERVLGEIVSALK
ncbi:MAG: exopolyphosphatase [Thermodesulfovibrionales bacterium]|nr:exopolyphosphatase [Thermodesulfovibrionales bacterium]